MLTSVNSKKKRETIMNKTHLQELLNEKKSEANLQLESLPQVTYSQLANQKTVNITLKDTKRLIEDVKALEYVLTDDEIIADIEAGKDDWEEYSSPFKYN